MLFILRFVCVSSLPVRSTVSGVIISDNVQYAGKLHDNKFTNYQSHIYSFFFFELHRPLAAVRAYVWNNRMKEQKTQNKSRIKMKQTKNCAPIKINLDIMMKRDKQANRLLSIFSWHLALAVHRDRNSVSPNSHGYFNPRGMQGWIHRTTLVTCIVLNLHSAFARIPMAVGKEDRNVPVSSIFDVCIFFAQPTAAANSQSVCVCWRQ